MNPLTVIESTLVPYTAFEEGLMRIQQCYEKAIFSPEPICLAIIGESRTGKSRLLEEATVDWKKTRTEEGLTVPVLRMTTPSKPTVKGVVSDLLNEIGDPQYEKGTEINKTIRLRALMREVGTRMIIFDEFQHFHDRNLNKISQEVADWLKVLVDKTKVCLVVAGLPNCKAVIDRSEQLTGRFLRPIQLPRFDWSDNTSRKVFTGILAAFSESLKRFFSIPDLEDLDMSFRFYCATGGLMGYLTRLLRQAVWDACDEKRTVISLNHFESAYKKCGWSESPLPGRHPPFHKKFLFGDSDDVLAMIRKIGIPVEPETPERPTRSKRKTSTSEALRK